VIHPTAAPTPAATTSHEFEALGPAPGPFFAVDGEWRLIYVNAAAERLLERDAAELLGHVAWDIVPHAPGAHLRTEITRAMESGTTVAFTAFSAPLGRWFDVEAVPRDAGLSIFLHDVTTLKEAERVAAGMASMHRSLQAVATAVAEGAGPETVFDLVCRQSARLAGAAGSWLVRFTDEDYEVLATTSVAGPRSGDVLPVRAGTELEVARSGTAVVVPAGAGGRFAELGYCGAALVPVRMAGDVWGCLAVAWEVENPDAADAEPLLAEFSQLVAVALGNAAAHSALALQATTDPLTGLVNLRTLHDVLDRAVGKASDGGEPVALALVDIDHFKAVNDGHGHETGDAVLRGLGGTLQGACRRRDVAARIGGDEFALVLVDCDAAAASEVAERVRQGIESASGENGLPQVTVSVGVAAWESGLDREAMQRRADDALYWAKLHGRNAVWSYHDELMGGEVAPARAAALRRAGTVVDAAAVDADLRRARSFWQSALDGLTKQIAVMDASGVLVAANAAWQRFGVDEDGVPARPGVGDDYLAACDAHAGHPTARDISRGLREVSDGTRDEFVLDHRYPRPSGDRWFTVRATRFEGGQGRIIITHQDVTDRHAAEERSAFQSTLLDLVAMPIYALDLDGRVQYWNRAAEELHGQTLGDVIGRPVDEIGAFEPPHRNNPARDDALDRDDIWEGEITGRTANGRSYRAAVTESMVRGSDGRPTGYVGTVFDLTERDTFARDLQAARDYLQTVTESIADGLVVFDAHGVVTYANRAARTILGEDPPPAGRLVEAVLRGRHDPGATDLRTAERADDDRFRRADGTELAVEWTAACLDLPAAMGEGTFVDAVGSRVVVFRDVTERRAHEARLLAEAEGLRRAKQVRDALDDDRFELHAQPIVSTADGNVVDHELLIRLRDRDGRLVLPGDFLPAAEEHGLIVEVDRWVTARAVDCAARGMAVHFNLSASSIGDPGVLHTLGRALERTGADPRKLTVEVTETALLHDRRGAAAFARHLQDLGCHVALDDFGAGYNSFVRVKDVPADVLKIDRQFVCDLLEASASESVVKAIVAFAQDVGLRVIAEGVEDEATGARLHALGVHLAQGFHFGRPAPLPTGA
jgi:diguanylate cyclase (GGDEF)-like protein/PAS domain S-box-containing protein